MALAWLLGFLLVLPGIIVIIISFGRPRRPNLADLVSRTDRINHTEAGDAVRHVAG